MTSTSLAILGVVLLPLLIGAAARLTSTQADTPAVYLFNARRNGFVATCAGAVAGNIGIGSFVAIHLFASESPVIGVSVAAVYTLGLIIAALAAPWIRARARQTGTIGLVEMVARTHRLRRAMLLIWLPVALVFVLRSAVQLGALGALMSGGLGLPLLAATGLSGAVIALYLLLGGYRAAVLTDMAQAGVILSGMALAGLGLWAQVASGTWAWNTRPFMDTGRFGPTLLVGIWSLLPFTPVLAIDNWQRITLAQSDRVARNAFLVAASLCGPVFALMAFVGMGASTAPVQEIFARLMPGGLGWMAAAMFVACIMSSIDTFIMPLGTAFARDRAANAVNHTESARDLSRLRGIICALAVATTAIAMLVGDLLQTVVTAFSTLSVFLPVVLGALVLHAPPARAAIWSVLLGFSTSILLSLLAPALAGPLGFALASLCYAALALPGAAHLRRS